MIGGVWDVVQAYRKSREWVELDPKKQGADRRIFHRVPLRIACTFTNPAFGLETTATTINVSLDGLGATAPVNWSEGNRIRVRLGSLPFSLAGVIVFRKEEAPLFRYGVRFQTTGIFQILKLRRFLKQHFSGPLSL